MRMWWLGGQVRAQVQARRRERLAEALRAHPAASAGRIARCAAVPTSWAHTELLRLCALGRAARVDRPDLRSGVGYREDHSAAGTVADG